MDKYHFQYCQKIVVLSKDLKKVLLCKRKGEADFDGVFSFIGGKMEITDSSIIDGLRREKNEEVGSTFKVRVFPKFSINVLFRKKDGNSMILPHYLAIHEKGDIQLNEEYSEYKWVDLDTLQTFEPKIPKIHEVVRDLMKLPTFAKEEEFVLL